MTKAKNIAQGSYVTVIEPRDMTPAKLRVAAYARVSSDSEDQLNSYIAQVDFYTRFISTHEGWEMVDIYADEGLTGMDASRREEFNRMIADCRDGKIDRILVKSIARFARNQADYILNMRELLRLGVAIYFEKENIDTGKMSSEQVADIYGAFAQMETTGHSQNMRISYRMRMEKGIFTPPTAPYGYRLIDKALVLVPEEAEIVRHIYRAYLSGQGHEDIARELNSLGAERSSESGLWRARTVEYILTNITYTGDQIWQKSYATDTLPFKQVQNRGQKPKYFAQDCCPAIISKEEFELAQALTRKRLAARKPPETIQSPYRKHIFCAECGALCRGKMINGKLYWICNRRDQEKANCPVPQVAEEEITEALRRFYQKIWHGKDIILRPVLSQLKELQERELRSNQRVADIDAEIAKLTEQNLVLTRLKSKGYMDSALYLSELDEINGKARELRKLRRRILDSTHEDKQIRQTEGMLEYLDASPEWLDTVAPSIFTLLIDRLLLTADGAVNIRLLNGLEVTEELGKAVA